MLGPVSSKVGPIDDLQMSRDKLLSKKLNTVRNSDKLKIPAAPGSGELFSLSTGAA